MATQRRLQSRGSRVAIGILGMFILVTTAWGQGVVEYRFRGRVTLASTTNGYWPLSVGMPVDGALFIDYRASDSYPDPDRGTYASEYMGWRLRFRVVPGFSQTLATANRPGNYVDVVNGSGMNSGDGIFFYSPPETMGAEGWSLDLYDPSGRALVSDALPGSIDVLRGFTEAGMWVAGYTGNPDYPYYEDYYRFSVTFVPEPSVVVLSGAGLALLGMLRCRSRSTARLGRLDAEPDTPPNGGPATRLGDSRASGGPPSVS